MLTGHGMVKEEWFGLDLALAAALEGVCDGVLIFDHRGIGESVVARKDTRQALRQGYSIEEGADDALAVADALGVDKFHLLGLSMGGLMSQSLAHRHPTRVESLTLLSTGAGTGTAALAPGEPSWVFERFWKTLDPGRVLHVGHEQHLRDIEAMKFTPAWIAANPRSFGELLRWSGAVFRGAPAIMAQRQLLRDVSLHRSARMITMPTLVVHGNEDEMLHVSKSHELVSLIPNAKLVVIPHSGHLTYVTHPQTTLDAIVSFICQQTRKHGLELR